MCKFRKELIDPIKFIKSVWPSANIFHIIYDENMKTCDREYYRVEQGGHDGTQIFTHEMLQRLLLPVMNMSTNFKHTTPESWDKVAYIKYTIGKIRLATAYGKLELKCGGVHSGQVERAKLPIRCEYVMK